MSFTHFFMSTTVTFVLFSALFLSHVHGQDEPIDNAGNAGGKQVSKGTGAVPTSTAKPSKPSVNAITVAAASNCTNNASCVNKTQGNDETSLWNKVKHSVQENKGMLLRTFYVLIGLTAIVIIYFVVRAWRLRRKRSKSRKYGLITTRGSDLEMAPLDQDDDDDDEDMTVFELNNRRKR